MKNVTQLKKTGISQICICAILSWGGVFNPAMAQNNVNGFTANAGQMKDTDGSLRSDLLYTANAAGAKIYLRQTGISFCWYQAATDSLKKDSAYRMDVDFVNPSSALLIAPSDKQNSYSNYFIGNVSASNVAEYGKVSYQNIWLNIDLLVTADSNGFTYKYHLKKGANPADIKLSFNGGKSFQTGSKSMNIAIPFGNTINFLNPSIKNLSPSKTQNLISSSLNSSKVSSLSIGNYNSNSEYEVVQTANAGPTPCGSACLASPTLAPRWSTYYGGSSSDGVSDIENVQTPGNIFADFVVVGSTSSQNFPVFNTNILQSNNGGIDIFITRFKYDRSRKFSIYFGMTGNDFGASIALAPNEDIIFVGKTNSTDYRKETPTGAYYAPKTNNSFNDGVITRISNNGQEVLWSTYYGSSNDDYLTGLSISSTDQIYVNGWAHYAGAAFDLPIQNLTGAYNQTGAALSIGPEHSYLARFNSTYGLEWSTYFGGSNSTMLSSSAIDANNNFFVYGTSSNLGNVNTCTSSSNGRLPICTPTGSYSQNYAGASDAYLVKFNTNGQITWSTFYGGSTTELFSYCNNCIDIDNIGNVYITGQTKGSFPGVGNYPGNQSVHGGLTDAFIVKFSNNGTRNFASYIGGNSDDYGNAIGFIPNYGYSVVGQTGSTNFPILNGLANFYQPSNNGNGDGFYTQFNLNNTIAHSTYFGGGEQDNINAISYTNYLTRNIILAGSTSSSNFYTKDITNSSVDYFDDQLNNTLFDSGSDGFLTDITYNCGSICRELPINSSTLQPLGYSIFPNPSNTKLTFLTADQLYDKISIKNILGQEVNIPYPNFATGRIEISVESLINGIYFYELKNNKKSSTGKFIVIH